jgi:hypothetical protein
VTFKRELLGPSGTYRYTCVEDPRFSVEGQSFHHSQLGVGSMVFGNYTYGDGSVRVTAWGIRFEGSPKWFGSAGKLTDQKARISDPEFRAWVEERAAA